jgi:hypothetical protein
VEGNSTHSLPGRSVGKRVSFRAAVPVSSEQLIRTPPGNDIDAARTHAAAKENRKGFILRPPSREISAHVFSLGGQSGYTFLHPPESEEPVHAERKVLE